MIAVPSKVTKDADKVVEMLLEYGLKNFFSFKEGVTVSFRLDANCPASISKNKEYTPVLCVKGANASGKTQLLKGLAFIGGFASNSFSKDPESFMSFSSFYENDDPTEFYVDFEIDGVGYFYEVVATDKEVKRETISRSQKRRTKIIERIGNEIVLTTKEFSKLKTMKLRSNASLISTAHQYDWSEIKEIYDFFDNIFSNVGFSGVRESDIEINDVSKIYRSNSDYMKFVTDFISECDVGINKIEIIETKNAPDGKVLYFPAFCHLVDGKEQVTFDVTESSGTKHLYKNLALYKLVLDKGGVLILDEFDIYLHPHITPKLVDLFVNEKTNPNGAQLIFSSHNAEIMDNLGRYRVYLVNKRDNESFAYRLDEVPGDVLRNDRSIVNPYNEGKIGGVPRL